MMWVIEKTLHQDFIRWLRSLSLQERCSIIINAYDLKDDALVPTLYHFSSEDLQQLKTVQGKSEMEPNEANKEFAQDQLFKKIDALATDNEEYKSVSFTNQEVEALRSLLDRQGKQEKQDLSEKLIEKILSKKDLYEVFLSVYIPNYIRNKEYDENEIANLIKETEGKEDGYIDIRNTVPSFFKILETQDTCLKRVALGGTSVFYSLDPTVRNITTQNAGNKYLPLEEKDILIHFKARKFRGNKKKIENGTLKIKSNLNASVSTPRKEIFIEKSAYEEFTKWIKGLALQDIARYCLFLHQACKEKKCESMSRVEFAVHFFALYMSLKGYGEEYIRQHFKLFFQKENECNLNIKNDHVFRKRISDFMHFYINSVNSGKNTPISNEQKQQYVTKTKQPQLRFSNEEYSLLKQCIKTHGSLFIVNERRHEDHYFALINFLPQEVNQLKNVLTQQQKKVVEKKEKKEEKECREKILAKILALDTGRPDYKTTSFTTKEIKFLQSVMETQGAKELKEKLLKPQPYEPIWLNEACCQAILQGEDPIEIEGFSSTYALLERKNMIVTILSKTNTTTSAHQNQQQHDATTAQANTTQKRKQPSNEETSASQKRQKGEVVKEGSNAVSDNRNNFWFGFGSGSELHSKTDSETETDSETDSATNATPFSSDAKGLLGFIDSETSKLQHKISATKEIK